MPDRVSLILLDSKRCRHSLNALAGALETSGELDAVHLRFAPDEAELDRHIAEATCGDGLAVIGLSWTTPQHRRVRQLVGRARQSSASRGRALWVAGGPHPSGDPQGALDAGFDLVVCGEGEATLLDLLRAACHGDDFSTVPGLVLRDPTGKAVATGPRPPVDLDRFPPFPLHRRRVVGPIEITRGCPFACAYCQTSHLLGARPRHRSVEMVARYASVIRQRGLRDVRVIAPDAFAYGSPDGRTLNLPALESLLAELRGAVGREGRLFFGTFPSEVRPEHVTEATLGLLRRYADNDNLILGAQSGSPRVLEACRRGHTVADVVSAVVRTIAAGLTPHVDMIFGLPGETAEDQQQSMELMLELAARGALIHAHTFVPLPQTAFFRSPPGRVPRRLRAQVAELIHRGRLYGVWNQQRAHNTD